jgi:hypothetical protein
MNCPNCNSPNSDGKKYCSDCGTPLDPQMQRLEIFVKAQVEKAIQEKFKDQKLVDVETSQAIAERLHGWGKLFGFFVALPVAILLIVLSIGGIERYSDFKSMIGGIEQQVKPKLEQAKSDAEQAQKTASEAKGEADDAKKTIEGATTEAKRQLGSATELAKNVKALSDRVSGLEQQTSNQMKGSSQRVDARVVELDQKIDAATKDIAEQQKRLASTDELVKTLFSKGTTEYFQTKVNAPNVVILPLANGAIVFMLLKSPPIYQTLELKWRVASQPRNSYNVSNNVVTFYWGESADGLRQFSMEVTYVPDPTSKTAPFKTLSLKDNGVFADETKLMDLPH